MPAISDEIDTGSCSTRGQPPGEHGSSGSAEATEASSAYPAPGAEHLAEQITNLLAEPEPKGP